MTFHVKKRLICYNFIVYVTLQSDIAQISTMLLLLSHNKV